MRYLITWKALRVPPQMAKVAIALINASQEYTEKLVKKGQITEIWAYADGSGGGCVGVDDSHENIYKAMMADPYSPFLEYSITPLIDFNLALDIAKEKLNMLAGK